MFRFSVKLDRPKKARYPETVKLAEMILFLFICACVHLKLLAVPNPYFTQILFPFSCIRCKLRIFYSNIFIFTLLGKFAIQRFLPSYC
jgi:hypothetical protein